MANQWNQNQYGNQGGNYPPQQQYNNQQPQYNQQQQYNPQQNNYPQQQQYNQQPQYNNNPQQNYPPQQQQQYNQQQPQQYNQQPQYNQQQQGGNWNPPPNQQNQNPYNNNNNPNNNNNRNEQTWTNKPKVKVTQKGNMTITETTESGGGKGRSAMEYGGPPQLGPGRVKSSGPYQPQTDQEQYDYFRLKLWELNCCCGCGNTEHPCLNLWIWAIWWLIIFIFNGLINLIASLAYTTTDAGTYAIISIIIIIIGICINCFAMYALFKLIPIAFLIQLIMFVVFFLLVCIALFIYPFSFGYLVMSLLFIVCDIWAFVVFYRVWAWAKHFKSGGNYDPDMKMPPR